MKTLSLLCVLFACVGATGFSATAPDVSTTGPVVPLPPFHVEEFSNHLGFTWNATVKSDKISSVRFSRVEARSLASRAGLIENDHLVAIDGHPVVGLTLEQLQRFFARDWKGGETLNWDFTIERGAVFTTRQTISLRMRTKLPDPAATPANAEPTVAK